MAMKKVIRDAAGAIINIGDWDHQMEPVYEADPEQPIFKDDITKPIYEGLFFKRFAGYEQELAGYGQKQVGERARNPLPEGAYEDMVEVEAGVDGGLYATENHRALRQAAYPHIGDQLDALFKAGAFPPEMAAQIAAVKAKYPKAGQ